METSKWTLMTFDNRPKIKLINQDFPYSLHRNMPYKSANVY